MLLYFPLDGGMLLPAGLGYDPQLIKPPSNYRGSDQMDYAAAMAAAGIVVKGKRPEFLDKIASLSEPPPPDATFWSAFGGAAVLLGSSHRQPA